MKHIESEIRLQNDRNLRNYCLQNYDSRFWPLLSFLETDFLLQIEKIMFYGWNNDYGDLYFFFLHSSFDDIVAYI